MVLSFSELHLTFLPRDKDRIYHAAYGDQIPESATPEEAVATVIINRVQDLGITLAYAKSESREVRIGKKNQHLFRKELGNAKG